MLKHENTWKCPICKGKATFDDLRVDSFFHQVLQSKNLPEDAQEIVLDSNASWKVYEDIEAEINVIDLTEEDDSEEDTNLSARHPSMEKNQPRRMMLPYIKMKRLSKSELLWWLMPKAPHSDKENNTSPDPDEDEIPDFSGDEVQVQDKDEVVEIMTTRPIGPVAADEDLDKIPISTFQPFLEEDLPIQEVIVIFSK